MPTEPTHWRRYYEPELLARADRIRQTAHIDSTGVRLHIDCYPQPDPAAPVILFNHGAIGYCRIFVRLAMRCFDLGYTFVIVDQKGQGLSEGRRGDYIVTECVQNILDAAQWAEARFSGPLFLAGGSVGGALTYYAAAARQAQGCPVPAAACVNLFDFSRAADATGFSRLAGLANQPWVAEAAKGVTCALGAVTPGWRVPVRWIGAFDKLMGPQDAAFKRQWDADPVPPRLISWRSMASSYCTPPAVPLEANATPMLVLNQGADKMVDPAITRRNYERLGGPKRYMELAGFEHWSNHPDYWNTLVAEADAWFRLHMNKETNHER